MPRKPRLLHVRQHLEHLERIFEGLEKYGPCPLLDAEIAKARIINKAILDRHAEKQTRKDIYVEKGA